MPSAMVGSPICSCQRETSLTFVSTSLEGISGAPFSFACKLNFGEAQALPERGPSHRCAPLRIVGG